MAFFGIYIFISYLLMFLGHTISSKNRIAFSPIDPKRAIASSFVTKAADIARKQSLLHKFNDADPRHLFILSLFSVETAIWRKFPSLRLSSALRDDKDISRRVREGAKLQELFDQEKGIFPTHETLRLLKATVNDGNDDTQDWVKALSPREELILLGKGLARDVHCSTPADARIWLNKLRKIKFAGDEYESLAQAFILTIIFLLTHPFADGNGRLSRVAFNKWGSPKDSSASRALPLSVFFLLQKGKLLYSVLCSNLTRLNTSSLLDYFHSCCMSSVECLAALKHPRYRLQFSLDSEGCDFLKPNSARTELNDLYRAVQLMEPIIYRM